MKIEMLADRYNHLEAVNELREEWLEGLLLFLGVDIELLDRGSSLFLEYLHENQVFITEYPSIQALEVEYDGEVVGEWGGPVMQLVKDTERGGYYYKIEIESWSIQEEDIDL